MRYLLLPTAIVSLGGCGWFAESRLGPAGVLVPEWVENLLA